jgi:hypothetical protein
MKKISKYSFLSLSLLLGYTSNADAYCMYSIPPHELTAQEQIQQIQRIKDGKLLQAPYSSVEVTTWVPGHWAQRARHQLTGKTKACYNHRPPAEPEV